MNSSLQLENDALVTDSLSPSDADGLESSLLNENSSLETVLAAWNDATTRLQETHEVLQTEVGKLAKLGQQCFFTLPPSRSCRRADSVARVHGKQNRRPRPS